MVGSVNRSDIQGMVASGYDHLDYVRYSFLHIPESSGAAARNWLRSVVDRVTTAKHPGQHKSGNCLNIALTHKGIGALGFRPDSIDGFSHEFVGGMTRTEAAQILGDTGDSEQKNWEFGGHDTENTRPLHILVVLYGDSERGLDDFARFCGLDPLVGGLVQVYRQDSSRRHLDRTEPFGFRDGISQPKVIGLTKNASSVGELIKTGEFLLGYEDESGFRSRVPSIGNWEDPNGYLAEHPDCPRDRRAFGMNGSYLVFRKLSQDVGAFLDFVASKSENDPPELIAAKLMGRWRSGAPLVVAPKNPGANPENDFLYMPSDPDGLSCPIGSHIRRANPRDSLPMGPARSLEVSKRHRIIRRGRKYGVPVDPTPDCDESESRDRGICFVALNADLLRQFEFIQQTWLNNPEFNGLDNDKDPIVGDNNGKGEFTLQDEPINRHLQGLPRFVTVKGGGYFFLPGISTLRFLANYQPTEAHAQIAPGSSIQADKRSRSEE
jgi:Dyp-type peroxidase family